jgi:hypothetical protein
MRFGYPKKFVFDGGVTPLLDYFSGLVSINGKPVDDSQRQRLKQSIGTKYLTFVDDYCREKFNCICDIFHGIPMNKLEMDILGESLLYNVVSFYNMSLEVFYKILYAMVKHVRMSYSDFMKISHAEASIIIGICS